MSLFFRQKRLWGISGAQELIPARPAPRTGVVNVTNDTALRNSAVWACLRLRANLISTMPLDVFRMVDDIQVEMPKAPILVNPGGERVDIIEWRYSTQIDLDRTGNTIGLITERNAAGLPARIDLQKIDSCTVRDKNGVIKYRIDGREYDPEVVWHEKQYTVSGLAIGLSPVAYAAMTIGQYQSAQQFALNWYGTGGIPKAHLKNNDFSEITAEEAGALKTTFKAAVEGNDIFLTGKGWEYAPIQAEAVGAEWLEAQKYGIGDIARFFDCPGDLIDAVVSTGHVTYASVTQRNLQFLIMHLGPAIVRREAALSKLLPKPRFVKFNTSSLLRMDDETRARVYKMLTESRVMTPDEAREKENRPPLTDAQVAEFDHFWPPKTQKTTDSSSNEGDNA